MAKRMRIQALHMAKRGGANGAHLGPAFSMIELAACLYGNIMRHSAADPTCVNRDRFILSKGHAVLAYYTALHEMGYITQEELDTFEQNDGYYPGHPCMNLQKGIETSSGSLGMGLSLGIGQALAGKARGLDYTVYVMLGDGECGEGSIWEGAMSAPHYALDNLVTIIDRNKLQYDGDTEEIMPLGDFAGKWSAFGWHVLECDGHNIDDILGTFNSNQRPPGKPTLIIAHTIKGKGGSFMENNRIWHHGVMSPKQYEQALAEQQ